MSIETAVISFGSPRSGTTYIRRALGQLEGVFVSKIPEQAPNHPSFVERQSWGAAASSEEGLIGISRWMQKEHLVLVRTVRHPMECVRSLLAAREPELREKIGGLADNSDEEIVEWIRTESLNFHRQVGWLLANPYRHRLIQVRYELLGKRGRRRDFAEKVCSTLPDPEENTDRLARWLHDTWKEKPARIGRLSSGVEPEISEERMEFFLEALAPTIEREGYTEGLDWDVL